MSVRNFTRVFHQQSGLSTSEFIETARFDRARQLLAELDIPIKAIASRTGFTSDEHMRRVFQKRLGITPRVYRKRFATTGIGALDIQTESKTRRTSRSESST